MKRARSVQNPRAAGNRSAEQNDAPRKMGWLRGLEPPTTGITIQNSNQLSYSHHRSISPGTFHCTLPSPPAKDLGNRSAASLLDACRAGAPGRTRTCNHRLRRPVLYPVELRALGTESRRRTRGNGMVGVEGFEPPTSCSQSRRATRLRYTPPTSYGSPPRHSARRAVIVRSRCAAVNSFSGSGRQISPRSKTSAGRAGPGCGEHLVSRARQGPTLAGRVHAGVISPTRPRHLATLGKVYSRTDSKRLQGTPG